MVALPAAETSAKPVGLTQLSVLIEVAPFKTSLGTEPSVRDQNQTLINEVVRSIAYLRNVRDQRRSNGGHASPRG